MALLTQNGQRSERDGQMANRQMAREERSRVFDLAICYLAIWSFTASPNAFLPVQAAHQNAG